MRSHIASPKLVASATLVVLLPTVAFAVQSQKSLLSLTQIAKLTVQRHFALDKAPGLREFVGSFPVPEQYKRPAGVFVTLSKNGKTRACWGSVQPTYANLVEATIYTTEAALNNEYRYSRITASELPDLKVQVTVIRALEPIARGQAQDPSRYGLLVRAGGRGAVMLPGEAKDAHYQMVQCKLKAGIKTDEPYQLYRIKADVFR